MTNTQTAAEERIPVTVLTGFLGSGKTTLLNKLLRRPELADTAVIINEFGEIGLDHLLVEKSDDEGMVTLNSGCLCCTVRGDLVRTMSELFLKRSKGEVTPFKRMVVETTGLGRSGADPAHADDRSPARLALPARRRGDDGRRRERRQHARQPRGGDQAGRRRRPPAAHQGRHRRRAQARRAASTACIISIPARPPSRSPAARSIPTQILNAGLYNPESKTADVKKWLQAEAYEGSHDHGHGHASSRARPWP